MMATRIILVICMFLSISFLHAAEHIPYSHDTYDELVNPLLKLSSESMGSQLYSMRSHIVYTSAQHVPGSKESGVGYYYDNKKKKMKRYFFYRIKSGPSRKTDRKLDFRIQGKGFFVIELPGGWPAYTHDGRFELNEEGVLVTMSPPKMPVLGENGPIRLPDDNVFVTREGKITHNDKVIDIFRVEWVKNTHDLLGYNHSIFHLSYADYKRGDKFAEPDYIVEQGYIEESSIDKGQEHVQDWRISHEMNVKVVKQYMENLRSSLQAANPQ